MMLQVARTQLMRSSEVHPQTRRGSRLCASHQSDR